MPLNIFISSASSNNINKFMNKIPVVIEIIKQRYELIKENKSISCIMSVKPRYNVIKMDKVKLIFKRLVLKLWYIKKKITKTIVGINGAFEKKLIGL